MKPCFVIAPIGEEGSDVRKRSDQILEYVIGPAADECGYKATRADEIDDPGMITSQILQRIVEDPLVIADLTGWNPNVFYELALRHTIKKPLVQIIQKGERIPFDVASMRTILVDHRDLDSANEAREEIAKQVKSLEENPDQMDTPISVSLELQALKQSDNPIDQTLGEILKNTQLLRSEFRTLFDNLGDLRMDVLVAERPEAGASRAASGLLNAIIGGHQKKDQRPIDRLNELIKASTLDLNSPDKGV